MPETPSPGPEFSPETEHLQELGGKFAEDLAGIADTKESIIQRAMGEEAYSMYQHEREVLDYSEYVSSVTYRDDLSPEAQQYLEIAHILAGIERVELQGGAIGYADNSIESEIEDYVTDTGEKRMRFTDYHVSNGVIVAENVDRGEDDKNNYDEMIRQREREKALGINQQPVPNDVAEHIQLMASHYHAQLESILLRDDESFSSFIEAHR